MSYHERNIITYLITGIIVMTLYSFHMYDQYQAGLLDGPDAGIQVGWSAIKLIAGSVVITIIVTVIITIVNAIITKNTEFDEADERDKLIDMIGMKVAFITFSVFYVTGMIWLAFGAPMQFILLGSIYAMFMTSMIEGITRLVLYRRGF
ncbi:hypothetical protein [Maritalea mediterranea]|uniref:DUF2975 domain-containing protein n=1 Tax=Maritalea mediterranea TaxID=2909667 RepID=A0ABS9ED28_9HYPH|nr:hypothetical protein [Maritalea mediterranea]MCF4099660.1 hypothetical protein [Maritalea mediterranea]